MSLAMADRKTRALPVRTASLAALLLCLVAFGAGPASAADDHMRMVVKGRSEAEQLWRRGFTLSDSALDASLQGMLDTLVTGEVMPPGVTLRVHVMRSPVNNAFCLPDGSIYVFAGLLAQLTSRDQLAFILRHEAQHALGDHAARQMRNANSKIVALSVLSMASSLAVGSAWGDALIQAGLELTANYSVNGYGRSLEHEADMAAAARLGPAGYDGCGAMQALEILRRQEKQPGRTENTFWGNHPLLQDRIRDVTAEAKVRDCALDSTQVSATYDSIKWPMLKLSAALGVAAHDAVRAARNADAYLARFPSDADAATTLGEAYAEASARDTTRATRSKATPPPAASAADTLALARAALEHALELGGPDYRPPLRGLALLAERQHDTTACIGYLERYLAGNAPVRDRRMLRNKLETLKSTITGRAPVTADSAVAKPANTPSEHKENQP
jgi:hypothetical protein